MKINYVSVFTFVIITQNKFIQFQICVAVYTDQGKVRALIRAALNERALERYISIWLSDTAGLNSYFESWALIRDNEASNLLPSIAAGQCRFCHNSRIFFCFCTHLKMI